MNETDLLIVFRAPGFSHPDVPPAARAALAYVFALALAGSVRARLPPTPAALVASVALEVAIGAAIGTGASLLYDGAYAGGRALDDYAGVRGSVPAANVGAGAGFGRLWSLSIVTAFFVLGGDRIALAAFAHTFEALPPGALPAARELAAFAVTLPATLVRAALFVAGPSIAAVFAVQIALAALARVVPRFATFTLSFGFVIAAVIATTALSVATLWTVDGPLRAARSLTDGRRTPVRRDAAPSGARTTRRRRRSRGRDRLACGICGRGASDGGLRSDPRVDVCRHARHRTFRAYCKQRLCSDAGNRPFTCDGSRCRRRKHGGVRRRRLRAAGAAL